METSPWFVCQKVYQKLSSLWYRCFQVLDLSFLRMSQLLSFVKKVWPYKWKLVDMARLKKMWQNILWDAYTNAKLYKLLYHLKNKWHLMGLRKDIFFVKSPDLSFSEQDLIDKFYWSVLRKHTSQYSWTKSYIWWLKALELHVMNFSAPDDILIVTENKQSVEALFFDKKILCKKYTSQGSSLFSLFYGYAIPFKIGNNSFRIATLELALLETLYSPDVLSWGYKQDLIKRIVKKYHSSLRLDVFETILRAWKHQASTKRLYDISLGVPSFSSSLLSLMKKYSFVS